MRKEFTHPVLRMMGIPRLRVPGRNWLIFWGVTGGFLGTVWYDRRERTRIKQAYKDQVAFLSEVPMTAMELPRRVTVYVAPPPNDYLEVSLQHFRDYVKPILTAAAVDHKLVTETRPGEIRRTVAEEIRNKRRAAQGLPTTEPAKDELDAKIDSRVHRDETGGVICIGRGPYKEYMAGLQEGWMGPLEEPKQATEADAKAHKQIMDKYEAQVKEAQDDAERLKKEPIEIEEPQPAVPASWLRAEDYDEAQVSPEFAAATLDPLLVIRHPHLLGFLKTPPRVWRYLNQRKLADELGAQAVAVVMNEKRPFLAEDAELAATDEPDWPNSWRQKGADNDSEWMRLFRVDPRIGERLEVYDPKASSGNLANGNPANETLANGNSTSN